jgi:hypothetical protein
MSQDTGKGLQVIFWENLKQGWGILQKAQDELLEDVKKRRRNVLIWAKVIKNPKDNWDRGAREELYTSIMLQALDIYLFAQDEEDEKGRKIKRKMNKKLLDDARTDAALVVEGARSPSMLKIPMPEDQERRLA